MCIQRDIHEQKRHIFFELHLILEKFENNVYFARNDKEIHILYVVYNICFSSFFEIKIPFTIY